MRKMVPRPTSLWTSIQPWCCWTMPKTVARPRPVPLPTSFVVKKGSKMCSLISAGMPLPVSVTARQAKAPGRAGGLQGAQRVEFDDGHLNDEPSAVGHGVAGVDGQVE